MKRKKTVRIGCASAFWGDTSTAAEQLVKKGSLDYLVFDFLAEVTMSILADAKAKDDKKGYAIDFVEHIRPILDKIKEDKVVVISNAGGMNPYACKIAIEKDAIKFGIDLNIAVVTGDDLIDVIPSSKIGQIKEMETGMPMPENCLSMNAYIGSSGIISALKEGADIIITGRCVDSALVLAPLMYEFKWNEHDYNMLAAGSLAGHIIECGTQCTGGNFTDWKEVENFNDMGFPIVEVSSNGNFIVSKPENTGGVVNFGTVAEQLLYEIGDPSAYLLPDVVCDFTEVEIIEIQKDKVFVKGAKGYPPGPDYKVSATYIDGYRVSGTLVIGGRHSVKKGNLIAKAILEKCSRIYQERNLLDFTRKSFDIIGSNSIYNENSSVIDIKEVVLRIAARHKQKEALIIFAKELAQAVTGMAPGVINYLGGRPSVSASIHLYSFLFPKNEVGISVEIGERVIPVEPLLLSKPYKQVRTKSTLYDDKLIDKRYSTPLINLAFARSGDKGNHANIGVIARKSRYFPYINEALTIKSISKYFDHVLKGHVERWEMPKINALNFLLKDSLGGGGMASLNIDPQGKSYAQQILEFSIPISEEIAKELNLI